MTTGIKCTLCGRDDAAVRAEELATARITRRAHVDCGGHAVYRAVSPAEIERSELPCLVGALITVARMPNAEHEADVHNRAVARLRELYAKEN